MKTALVLSLLLATQHAHAETALWKWLTSWTTPTAKPGAGAKVGGKPAIDPRPNTNARPSAQPQNAPAPNAAIARPQPVYIVPTPTPVPDIVVTAKQGKIKVEGNKATLSGVSFEFIDDILNMKDGETVSADVMKTYDSKSIAASLVRRLHQTREDDANEPQPAYNYLRDSTIQMRFNQKYITLIAKNGFLNQHRTGSSNGALDGARRAKIEDTLTHVRLEPAYRMGATKANDVRPKYAFLGFPENSDGQQSGRFNKQYGNIVAVFKEEVKLRSTFTPVDTLDGDMSDDATEIVYGRVRGRSFYFRGKKKLFKQIDPNKDQFGRPAADFWEAQMWGPITMKDDVAYFLIGCPGDEKITKKSVENLKAQKIAIYKCEFLPDHSHFDRGDLLYAPDLEN